MSTEHEAALAPEDLARLFVECARAGDAEGLAALYEPDAVLAYPPGQVTVGRDAIRAVCERMLTMAPPPPDRRSHCPRCETAISLSPRPVRST
jgi:uncharacterized protein (TIGR02246 family)